ncbi:hypothetical protein NQ315_013480, partial [Exocentrus adspersus]
YGDVRRSQQETCNIFNNLYPNRNPITRSTVSKLLKKFNQTGAIKDLSKSGRIKIATTEDKSLDKTIDDPHLSTRQISRELDISQTSIMKILHDNIFHPYKVRLVQELSDDDFGRREEFADTMMEKCYDQNNPNFLNNVMFSDEATFCIDGNVNRHNCRYWSRNNPRWMRESHTQYPQKINVWAGIIGDKIIGPFFIEGNLNGPAYLNLLQNSIIPELARLFPNLRSPLASTTTKVGTLLKTKLLKAVGATSKRQLTHKSQKLYSLARDLKRVAVKLDSKLAKNKERLSNAL